DSLYPATMRVLVFLAPVALALSIHAYSLPAFGGCTASNPVVRPGIITIGCGDGGVYLNVRRWSSWTSKAAAGKGFVYVNRCTPDCAAGNFNTYRMKLRV